MTIGSNTAAELKAIVERVERLEDSARARIIALRGAIERIEHNRFGRCEYCLDPIAPERLLAIPYTRVCARCAP